MTYYKSHFRFTKGQRNGIFLLLLTILSLQCFYFFVDFSKTEPQENSQALAIFQAEIDSLKQLRLEESKPTIYPFNPNFITDYKGYTLGMTPDEIDRLHRFRDQDKWINSAKQFQQVTAISDSLLAAISPYFKFPDWVNKPRPKQSFSSTKSAKTYVQKIDLNTATAVQLQAVNGIGEKLSERIIRFRDKFEGGFIADVQLQDVYGLSADVVARILEHFTVKTPRQILKIKLNSATVEQLVTIQHIDYPLAHEIIDQRKLREGYKSLDELLKVKGFPVDKIEIIKLYLTLD